METDITVTINRTSVLADIRVKNQTEVAGIVDDKQRYLAEAGTEKTENLQQCITNAALEISASLRQFLTGYSASTSANDNYSAGTIIFTFCLTSRKSAGFAENMANAIHEYMVDSAMTKFYTDVSQDGLAAVHLNRLPQSLAVIETLCYRKQPPKHANYE